MDINWQPLYLTAKLAIVTTLILLLIGIPIAYALSVWKSRFKLLVQTLVSMPLVLPPTVLGFYLLLAFGRDGWLGSRLESWFDIRLVFSFEGLVIASIIYSLPFMVNPIQSGFQSLPASLHEAAQTLGKSHLSSFFHVLLPNIKPAIITATVVTFAHTIGEFGVVLMIGGSIPAETRVASIAIYDEVEALNFAAAHSYALILFVLAFVILLSVYLLNRENLRAF